MIALVKGFNVELVSTNSLLELFNCGSMFLKRFVLSYLLGFWDFKVLSRFSFINSLPWLLKNYFASRCNCSSMNFYSSFIRMYTFIYLFYLFIRMYNFIYLFYLFIHLYLQLHLRLRWFVFEAVDFDLNLCENCQNIYDININLKNLTKFGTDNVFKIVIIFELNNFL